VVQTANVLFYVACERPHSFWPTLFLCSGTCQLFLSSRFFHCGKFYGPLKLMDIGKEASWFLTPCDLKWIQTC